MSARNHVTAGFAAVTLAFGLVACDEDRSLSGPTEIATPAGAPQSLIAPITAANLVAALNNVTVMIGELNALNNITIGDVTVVEVEDVLNDARILNNSRFLNNITILQDFLNNSLNQNDVEIEILEDAVILQGFVITDVVAIDVLSGGDIVVFVQ